MSRATSKIAQQTMQAIRSGCASTYRIWRRVAKVHGAISSNSTQLGLDVGAPVRSKASRAEFGRADGDPPPNTPPRDS